MSAKTLTGERRLGWIDGLAYAKAIVARDAKRGWDADQIRHHLAELAEREALAIGVSVVGDEPREQIQ